MALNRYRSLKARDLSMADRQEFFDHEFFGEPERLTPKEQLYLDNGASEDIMKLVRLHPKTLGTLCKKNMSRILGLGPKQDNSDHDGVMSYHDTMGDMGGDLHLRIKLKSSCYWVRGRNYGRKWQHIKEIDDDQHDILILIGIGFQELIYYVLDPQDQARLIEQEEVKLQGGNDKETAQNYWVDENIIQRYSKPLLRESDVLDHIHDIQTMWYWQNQ